MSTGEKFIFPEASITYNLWAPFYVCFHVLTFQRSSSREIDGV